MVFTQFLPFILARPADTITILDTFLVGAFIPTFRSSFSCWLTLLPQTVLKGLNGFVRFLLFLLVGCGMHGFSVSSVHE